MAAKDYKLCVSPISGTVYLAKVRKRNPNEMTDDRVQVDKSEFIHAFLEWLEYESGGTGVLNITADDKVIVAIEDRRKL